MVRQFYDIQKKYPAKKDWVITVMSDLEYLQINLSLEEIKAKSKGSFSKLVKSKVKEAALKHLLELKNGHTKMNGLKYSELNIQNYLKSRDIYPKIAKSIFKYRTRMSNVKMNFKSHNQNNLQCPFPQCNENDSQEHLIEHSETTDLNIYSKLFSTNAKDNLTVINLLEKTMATREIYVDL